MSKAILERVFYIAIAVLLGALLFRAPVQIPLAVLLVALLVIVPVSVKRIIVAYRGDKGIDVAATLGLIIAVAIFACLCLVLLGPTIGSDFD